jgi:acyl dehydratase
MRQGLILHLRSEPFWTRAAVEAKRRVIHVDPERAKHSPFGGTIAHGYLTPSTILPLLEQLLLRGSCDYKVELRHQFGPLPGSCTSWAQDPASCSARQSDWDYRGVQLLIATAVELQDNPKPACFAELVLRFHG